MKFQLPTIPGKTNRTALKPRTKTESSSPFIRSLKGYKLGVTFHLKDGMVYDVTESWIKVNHATMRSMGYVSAKGYKSGWGDMLTKVYVRFWGFEKHPCIRARMNENGEIVEEVVTSMETSSTLYDYFSSDAEAEFMKGMKAAKITTLDWKKMATVGVFAVGIIIGMFMLMRH